MEKVLIQWLKERYGESGFARIGIGDDCAVLPAAAAELVVTCDAICEGVHFRSQELTPRQIGRKALAVNLSDLASMGAEAKTVLVSLTLPSCSSLTFAQSLYQGMDPLARRYGVGICGGDTTVWSGHLVISVTALGLATAGGPWTVDGARPGDHIVVTGEFGGSILKRHWAFEPRLDFARQWGPQSGVVHACTDVSDSLGVDLVKIARASRTGLELDLNSIPVSNDAARLAGRTGKTPLEHALSDGEDFELVLAVAPDAWPRLRSQTLSGLRLTCIGRFTEDRRLLAIENGRPVPFQPSGFEHRMEGG
jgi:thiamine-monophosphate kinase